MSPAVGPSLAENTHKLYTSCVANYFANLRKREKERVFSLTFIVYDAFNDATIPS